MLNVFGQARRRRRAAGAVVTALVSQARAPVFFGSLGVADTIDGRFDLVTLHAWLILERLKGVGALQLAQHVTDQLFASFDEALRELGVGDMSMGRRIRNMANAFYGRLKAYDEAVDEQALAAAVLRNVYRENAAFSSEAAMLARYVVQSRIALSRWRPEDGAPIFAELPG